MSTLNAGYRSLSLLLNLGLDRILCAGAITLALVAAGYLASVITGF